ncbi:hypothetical protein ACFY8S_01760 [Streptomyces hygroscopicus]|uniref:hypothetical protein n=1 Tax=Streptomyces hygroscopicus TaxID=1912 RepID=UPI0036A1EBFE
MPGYSWLSYSATGTPCPSIGRDSAERTAVGQRMDEAQLWQLIEDQGERVPLITRGEARAVVQLLQHLAEQRGELAVIAAEMAGGLARRLPAE